MRISLIAIFVLTFVAFACSNPQSGVESVDSPDRVREKRELSRDDRKQFRKWFKKHSKQYKTLEEELKAMEIWIENRKTVEEHNKRHERGEVSWHMELNEHSDLTPEEWLKRFTGMTIPDNANSARAKREYSKKDFPEGPKSLNWTQLVGPVENQLGCGSCWAFSVAGIINSALRKKDKNTKVLVSPQQLVDCDKSNMGCGGGWPPHGLDYAAENGMTSEEEYPYDAKDGTCDYSKDDKVAGIRTHHTIFTDDEEYMKNIVAKVGVIGCALCVQSSFQHYKGGVYKQENCCTKNNHAPLITGYGVDPKHGDYWIIKNSWGTSWGNNGYAKFARNVNMCHIAYYAVWAEAE